MIIVVEGCAGAGKSSVLYRLADLLACPVYRGFREPGGKQRAVDASMVHGLVKINTWREDIYVMDLLSQINVGAIILDRSLISAMAYEAVLVDSEKRALTRWWASRLKGRGLILHVKADCALAAARNKHGHTTRFIEGETRQMDHWCSVAAEFGVSVADVINNGELDAAVETALSAVDTWRRLNDRRSP